MDENTLTVEHKLYLKIIQDLHSSWMPHHAQIETLSPLINDEVDTVFLQCGRKFGKTELANYILWRTALLNPGAACYYVAPEKTHAQDILWLNGRLKFFGPQTYIARHDEQKLTIFFKNGSFIRVLGSENYQVANGITPTIIVYDEFKAFKPQFHDTMQPNRMVRKAPLLILGTPPCETDNNREQYLEYADECRNHPRAKWVNYSTYDNPHISKEWVQLEKEKYERRGEWDVFEREYMGRVVIGGKRSIFPMFNQDDHVRPHSVIMDEIRKDAHKLDWYVTADPGTTTCFATLFIAIHPKTRKIYILDEIYEKEQRKTTVNQIIPIMKAKFDAINPKGDFEDRCTKTFDEAAAWFCAEALDQHNLYFQATRKDLHKKENGLALIKDILLAKAVTVSDRCHNLINEIQLYALDDRGQIPKKNDHLIDCFRYTLASAYYTSQDIYQVIKVEEDEKRGYSIESDLKQAATSWLDKLLDFDGND